MPKKYSKEQKDYLSKISKGRYNDDITKLFNKHFNTNLTEEQIKALKQNNGIVSNVPTKRKNTDGIFNKEQKTFIKNNAKNRFNEELADLVNETFDLSVSSKQINTFKKNNGIKSGLNRRFKKGQTPWNKGMEGIDLSGENGRKTQFKKGEKSYNYLPVSSERVENKDGYVLIKISDEGPYQDRWRHKHLDLWEQHNGPIPDGHAVIFLDSDRYNIHIDNLKLVTRNELVRMNQNNLLSTNPELTKAGLNTVRLINKIIEHEIYGGDREEFQKYIRIAEQNGLSEDAFIARLRRGWSLNDAMYKPLHYTPKRKKEHMND